MSEPSPQQLLEEAQTLCHMDPDTDWSALVFGLLPRLVNALRQALHQSRTWEPLARERLDRIRELEASLKAAMKWDILAQDRADEIRKLRERLAQCAEPSEDQPEAAESPVKMCGGVHAGGLSGYLGRNRT